MAVRLANQINRRVISNSYRSWSSKREPIEAELDSQKVEDGSISQEIQQTPPKAIANMSITQYEVCRPRTTPLAPYPRASVNEADAVKNSWALQHLQPSMLPEYYKPPVEINAPCVNIEPVRETTREAPGKYRKFEESQTYKHVVLPLRAPKLANPFPEPVKIVMHSNTISDEEKAQQMFVEAKLMKATANTMHKQNSMESIHSLPPRRNYSTGPNDAGKIPPGKMKACKKKNTQTKCPKKKLPGCRPVSKNVQCTRKKPVRPPCSRKHPPYPSYSESCHEDPPEKTCEAKLCPWKLQDHPTFKPPKQDLHTYTTAYAKRKDECDKPPQKDKKPPCAYKKKKEEARQNDQKKETPPPEFTENVAVSFNCKVFRPQKKIQMSQSCKETKKICTFPKSRAQTAQASTMSLRKEMGNWLSHLQPESLLPPFTSVIKADDDDAGQKRITKFPFKEMTFEFVKERNLLPRSIGYLLDEKRPEAPKPCKDCDDPSQLPNYSGRCKKEKPSNTLICPPDLLTKKKRGSKDKNKKKTCPLIPLNRMPSAYRSSTTI